MEKSKQKKLRKILSLSKQLFCHNLNILIDLVFGILMHKTNSNIESHPCFYSFQNTEEVA
jgi:hypothetical protein